MSGAQAAPPDASPPPPGAPWTILRMILWSATYLEEKGVERARLDAEYLLAHALGMNRLRLYLEHERPLTPDEIARFKPMLLRRARREPLQHVTGRAAFRELDLRSDARALVPRPETEILVQVVLDWAQVHSREAGRRLTAADVGTGSGCIALSLAKEGPFERVVATDASPPALALAAENRGDAGLEACVELVEGDALEALAGARFDALVSNPPYVAEADRDTLAPEVVDWEPHRALFAEDGGTALLRRLVRGAPEHVAARGLLALEVGLGQADRVAGWLRESDAWGDVEIHDDLTRRPRIVTARRRS